MVRVVPLAPLKSSYSMVYVRTPAPLATMEMIKEYAPVVTLLVYHVLADRLINVQAVMMASC